MPASAVEPKFHTDGLIRLTRPQMFATMTGLLLAVLLAALDQTIVGTAEPRIISQLSGFDRYPWVSTMYLLTSTLAVPIFAKLSDMYGRKWFFLGGAIMFVVTSALCGAAGTLTFLPIDGMNQLIVFRGLQGIAAGTMMGLAFTIIGDIFSPAERGKYTSFFAATWGLASIFGPTLGGWLTDQISWRAVFYVNHGHFPTTFAEMTHDRPADLTLESGSTATGTTMTGPGWTLTMSGGGVPWACCTSW